MPKRNNPAGRLHDILSEALDTNAGKVRNAWAKVFDLEPNDTGRILYQLGQLIQLIEKAKDAVADLPNHDHDLYLQPLHELASVFSYIALDETWNEFRQRVDKSTMRSLAFCADALGVHSRETELPASMLAGLQARAEQLIEEMLASELPQELKELVISNLELVRSALLNYRLHGSEGLRHAMDINIGTVIRMASRINTEEQKAQAKKIWEFLVNLDTALSLASVGYQVAPPMFAVLSQIAGN